MSFADENSIVKVGPYGPVELAKDLDALKQRHPFLQRMPIGSSVMGKPLEALRFGRGSRYVQINAAFHANEWITSLLAMRYAEELARRECSGDAFASRLTVWVVPMVNPDGVQLVHEGVGEHHPYGRQLLQWNGGSRDFSGWKANIRGVDLNDQFPAGWEEERRRRAVGGPGPRDYSGECPLSEPEARCIASLTERESFDLVLALHTQGEEIYWNYSGMEPPMAQGIAERLGVASGYAPVALTDSDAGFKDWFIQRFRRPGFTIEAGLGVNPLPLEQAEDMYGSVSRLLDEALRVAMED